MTVHTGDDEAERLWTGEIGARARADLAIRRRELLDDGPDRSVRPVHRDLLRYRRGVRKRSRRYRTESRRPVRRDLERRLSAVQSLRRRQRSSDLPRKAIDTGAGLERMLAVCNGVASMYETDFFTDLVAAQPPIGQTTLSPRSKCARQNIIADHTRAATFLINDGVYPSNTDRGFVLRFLIRRAIRNGKLLGYPDGFLAGLVPAVVAVARAGLSGTSRERGRGSMTALRQEEQIFDRTLERGMAMLDRDRWTGRAQARRSHDRRRGGLHAARYVRISGRTDARDRRRARRRRRHDRLRPADGRTARARAPRCGVETRRYVAVADLPATARASLPVTTKASRREGEIAALARRRAVRRWRARRRAARSFSTARSFYAERGGQIGDRGIDLRRDGARLEFADTQYMGDAIAHQGRSSRRAHLRSASACARQSTIGGGARSGGITPRRISCSARSRTCSATTSIRPDRGSASTGCASISGGPAAR